MLSPVANAARSHAFTASYRGNGAGETSGSAASGSATLPGRGTVIGASTLQGSVHGVFRSRNCIVFSGRAVLEGAAGSIFLRGHNATACAQAANADVVSFTGHGTVTGGSGVFAGASGSVSFSGTYARQTGAVKIALDGELVY